jgi:peptidoglycan L-alanyl-D-glutamate endopeptidase CwlK
MTMASRKLDELATAVQELAVQLIERCTAEGLDLLVYCTLRSVDEQARLFCQGRTITQITTRAAHLQARWNRADLADLLCSVGPQPGKIVTFAGPGQSLHNYGLAFDAVPLAAGKPVWQAKRPQDKALWDLYGRLGIEAGLEWAGTWTRFREFPHMQARGTSWQAAIVQAWPLPITPEQG